MGQGKNCFEVLNLAEAMKRLKVTFSPYKSLCLLRFTSAWLHLATLTARRRLLTWIFVSSSVNVAWYGRAVSLEWLFKEGTESSFRNLRSTNIVKFNYVHVYTVSIVALKSQTNATFPQRTQNSLQKCLKILHLLNRFITLRRRE